MGDALYALRLPSGNLLGGLFVHGCQHIGIDGHDQRCSIQTAEATTPQAAVFFGDRAKARAVASLCSERPEIVRIELEPPAKQEVP